MRPVAIDNSELQGEEYPGQLRPGLQEHQDYMLVPESVWQELIDW